MLKVDEKIQIISLFKQGKGKRQIARELGLSKNTVKKHIQSFLENGDSSFFTNFYDKPSQCEPYKQTIIDWLTREPKLSFLRIHEKLISEHNFQYGYDSVRRFVSSFARADNIVGHFETTLPAEEAQVDFGYVGLIFDQTENKKRKAYVFCMRLIYSRYDYYEVVFDQKVRTFIQCHINAFKYFNGVPKNVKIDNLKAAILEASLYSPVYQREYFQFSELYGFNIHPARVYKARDKAFVENGIKYVKGNFFAGRSFSGKADCNEQLLRWMDEKSRRTHGTTRLVPRNVFLNEEQRVLIKLPERDYELCEWSCHKLHPDSFLRIEKSLYSAPFEYLGKKLFVKKTSIHIEIYDENYKFIYRHLKALKENARIKNPEHFPEYIEMISHGTYTYLLSRAEKHGFLVRKFCEDILKQHKCSGYRMIQGILALAKNYSDEEIDSAIERSMQYSNFTYKSIKNILTKNLIAPSMVKDFEGPDVNEKEIVENVEYQNLLKTYDQMYH